ncbi:MAG: hypothetical protein DFNUSKGM_002488, partial [Candidatus Fervidibacter sacchari]
FLGKQTSGILALGHLTIPISGFSDYEGASGRF